MAELNLQQKQAIEHGSGPLLVVAGAGTGKTTLLSERFKYLVQNNLARPDEILCLVFNDEAAGHLQDKILEADFDWAYSDLWIQTFHAFCDKILRRHALDIGLSDDFKVITDSQSWILMRKRLEIFDLDYYQSLGNPAGTLHSLSKHFKECKEEGIYPEHYLLYSEELKTQMNDDLEEEEQKRVKEIAQAYAMYQKMLLESNCLDFGDQLNYCLKLFKTRPNILKIYREQFKYILVDEFQDTNRIQYELIKVLALPNNNITAVGDDDQSIYRFRGAVLENVIDFCEDYPQAKKVVLKQNYRSNQNILDLAYKSITNNNPNRLEYYLQHKKEVAQTFEQQGIDLANLKKLSAQSQEQGAIEVMHRLNIDSESSAIIEKIKDLKKNWVPQKNDKDFEYPDFAILTRTNSQAQRICSALQREGIDFQFLASKGFYQKSVILEALSYLRLLDNYHENASMFKILRAPVFNFSEEDISKMIEFGKRKTLSIYECLKQAPAISGLENKTLEKASSLLGLIDRHRQLLKERMISEVFTIYLSESGYFDWIVETEKTDLPKAKESIDLLRQFLEQIKDFEEQQVECHLSDFLEQVKFEIESGDRGTIRFDAEAGSPDQVQVMTVHKAKGLEFNNVFVADLVEKHFPTISRHGGIEIPEALIDERRQKEGDDLTPVKLAGDDKLLHEQEERRLFYVALTRARKNLFLSYADVDPKLKNTRLASRFLVELGLAEKVKAMKIAGSTIEGLKPHIHDKKLANTKFQLPGHLSFSQLRAFEKCPLQYKFAHVMRIPTRGKPATTFGRSVHAAIYDFLLLRAQQKNNQAGLFGEVKDAPALGLEDLLSFYEKRWEDQWYESKKQKQDYFEKGKEVLKDFYKIIDVEQPKIATIGNLPALELGFSIKIGDMLMNGKIDRIDDMGQGQVEIMDYKTGKSKEKLEKEDKEQLLIYQIASKEVYGVEPIKLTYYYLEDNKRVSFLGKESELEAIKEKIVEFAQQVKDSDFPPKPGHSCQFCDFRDICEFRE